MVAKINEEVGIIDILVNNAGIIMRKPMLEMEADEFRKVIDVDLNAPFIVSKAVIPGMKEKGHGKIINICSMMSELGRETVSAYAAAKGGLKMLTKNICSEYGEYNIQCNGIGPGYIATPQTAPLREVQADGSRHPFDQFIISKTPAARWGTPEDLQGPAVFLASDASDFVSDPRESGSAFRGNALGYRPGRNLHADLLSGRKAGDDEKREPQQRRMVPCDPRRADRDCPPSLLQIYAFQSA